MLWPFSKRSRSPSSISQPLIVQGTISYQHSGQHGLKRKRVAMLGRLFCCGGAPSNRPKREHTRRRHRRKHGTAAPSKAATQRNELGGVATSIASETEYHDAREVFSVGDADHSPLSSAQVSPRAGSFELYQDETYQEIRSSEDGSFSESGSEGSESSQGFGARLVSCLSIMRASSPGETQPLPEGHRTPGAHKGSGQQRLPAGCTFARRSPSDDPSGATMCWDECEATTYQVRSHDYMRTKVKQPSSKAIYRLVAMDLFTTETKAYHVAKMFGLPPTGPPVVCKSAVGGGPEVVLPPMLIMNVQLPDYPTAFWGANDGPGQSVVYYFTLRDDFDPDRFENTAALGLLQRFVSNGREADGSPTRDRLKMIARVANLDEWAKVAPLNGTEYKLLLNYNEKPVLTRPQQMFYVGPNYLEVDLDVHSYAFLARKALWSYHDRLPTVVWENAFVIQGNCPEELPEQLLGCGRIYRSDFRQFRYLSDLQSPLHSPSGTPSIGGSRPNTATGDYPASSPATPATPAAAAKTSRTPQSRYGAADGRADGAVVVDGEAGDESAGGGGGGPVGPSSSSAASSAGPSRQAGASSSSSSSNEVAAGSKRSSSSTASAGSKQASAAAAGAAAAALAAGYS